MGCKKKSVFQTFLSRFVFEGSFEFFLRTLFRPLSNGADVQNKLSDSIQFKVSVDHRKHTRPKSFFGSILLKKSAGHKSKIQCLLLDNTHLIFVFSNLNIQVKLLRSSLKLV